MKSLILFIFIVRKSRYHFNICLIGSKNFFQVCLMPLSNGESESCVLQPMMGMCRGYFEKFYFNNVTGKCETFVYGGCGGIS